ncbi:uncharacterized protein LOC132300516 [Cornus florida]|uniref:uncharacterized protein LOC132300516 n=1 Tax=Cornus florida TaxID=4283 RepID=UPI00289B412C|nr:uncharacterized protein LOC132300516 [Cornus florida]
MSLEWLELGHCTSLEIMINLPKLKRRPYVYAWQCGKLVEAQNWFRLEPIQNIDAEMIKNLGLVELESIGKVDMKFYNYLTDTHNIGPIQAVYECGIVSIFHPGNEVPCWFSKKSRKSSICFNVPSLPNLKIRGLNVCIVYADDYSSTMNTYITSPFAIEIFNKTKDVQWVYFPACVGIPEEGENMKWSSLGKIGNQLEVGDEVVVSAMGVGYEVKEIGVDIVYEEEEKDTQLNNYTSSPDLSPYQVSQGRYDLRYYYIHPFWLISSSYDFIFGDTSQDIYTFSAIMAVMLA